MSEERKRRLSLLRKRVKLTEEDKRSIKQGQFQMYLDTCRHYRELKQQTKDEKTVEAIKLQKKIAMRIHYNSL
jgi:hypothetical protein